MSNDILKPAFYDPRLVQTRPIFSVIKGASNQQMYNFNSASPSSSSSQIFTVISPGIRSYMDRNILLDSDMNLQFSVTVAPGSQVVGQPVCFPGRDFSPVFMPLNSIVGTLTAGFNGVSVTSNQEEVFPALSLLNDWAPDRKLRTCPSALPVFASGQNQQAPSEMGSVDNMYVTGEPKNGSWPLFDFTDSAGNVLGQGGVSGSYTYNGQVYPYDAHGVPLITTTAGGGSIDTYPLFCRIHTTEKLAMSPFIWAEGVDNSLDLGIAGLTSINFQMTISPTQVPRVLQGVSASAIPTRTRWLSNVSLNTLNGLPAFPGARLIVNFLNPPLSLAVPPMSIVPYSKTGYYSSAGSSILAGASGTVQGNTFVLSSVPSLIMAYVRPQQYAADSCNYYLPISNLNVTFDNQGSIFAPYSQASLYAMSQRNGLNQPF